MFLHERLCLKHLWEYVVLSVNKHMEEQFCVLRLIPMRCCVKKILVSHSFVAIAIKPTTCVSVNNVMLPHCLAVQKPQEVCLLQVDFVCCYCSFLVAIAHCCRLFFGMLLLQ